jgi:hypothetical protein
MFPERVLTEESTPLRSFAVASQMKQHGLINFDWDVGCGRRKPHLEPGQLMFVF